jgi:hypothetical protein
MRFVPFAVGNSMAVHVYSDATRILLQLRRDVPTEESITKPSFKVALPLTPDRAVDIAAELLTAAKQARLKPKETAKLKS